MAFAEPSDVVTRLGRPLTTAESAMATAVIAQVTGLICEAVDRDGDWATALDPVPAALKGLCIEKVLAIGGNPNGLASESEQLGAHQHSKTYRGRFGAGADLFLTDQEERLARRAVYYTNAATIAPESMIDRINDLREGRDVDEDPA